MTRFAFALWLCVVGCTGDRETPPAEPVEPPPRAQPSPPPKPPSLRVSLEVTAKGMEGEERTAYRPELEDVLGRGGIAVDPAGPDGAVKIGCLETKGQGYFAIGGTGGTWPLTRCVVDAIDPTGKPRLHWELVGPDGPGTLEGDIATAHFTALFASPELRALPAVVGLALGKRERLAELVPRLTILGVRSEISELLALVGDAPLDPRARAAVALHRGDVAGALREGVAAVPELYAFLREAPSTHRGYLAAWRGAAALDDPRPLVEIAGAKADPRLARLLVLVLRDKGAIDALAAEALPRPDRDERAADPTLALLAEAGRSLPARPQPLPVTLRVTGKHPLVPVEAELRPLLLAAGLDAQPTAAPVGIVEVRCQQRPGPAFRQGALGDRATARWTRVACKLGVTDAAGKSLLDLTVDPTPPPRYHGEVDDAVRAWFLGSDGFWLLAEASALALGRSERAPVVAALSLGFSLEQSPTGLASLLGPHEATLPATTRAAWLLARRKLTDAAALGDAALAPFWILLTAEWGTAASVGNGLFTGGGDPGGAVAKRIPAVTALATIDTPGARALAASLLRDYPVAKDREPYLVESHAMMPITAAVLHPAREEGKVLEILLPHARGVPWAAAVIEPFTHDARPGVRSAALAAR